jgi:hypothetical protein
MDFCRTVPVGDPAMQVCFLVDLVGRDKWGITIVYPCDDGKLVHHQLETRYESSLAALAEIDSNCEELMNSII